MTGCFDQIEFEFRKKRLSPLLFKDQMHHIIGAQATTTTTTTPPHEALTTLTGGVEGGRA